MANWARSFSAHRTLRGEHEIQYIAKHEADDALLIWRLDNNPENCVKAALGCAC